MTIAVDLGRKATKQTNKHGRNQRKVDVFLCNIKVMVGIIGRLQFLSVMSRSW